MSTKRKFNSKLGQPAVKPSAKPAAKESLNDSRAVVSKGGHTGQIVANGTAEAPEIISSDSESSGEEEEDDGDEKVAEQDTPQITKVSEHGDVDMEDVEGQGAAAQTPKKNEEPAEPSFGDLIFANSSEPVDVAGAFNDSNLQTLSYPQSIKLKPPTGASLGTVLTQALKTNDITLLESCLQTPDTSTIRATIQRLDSPLAGSLLQKLAERLHRRPGRAGSLMVWVQWTLVTHGGYLATQPDLIKKLAELNRVIDERARGLQSLLSLKGKLDMLEAQMQLRQSMRQQRGEQEDEDDEEGVIYVEGEEEESDEPGVDGRKRVLANGKLKQSNGPLVSNDAESEVSDDMPTTNGAIVDSDAEDSEDDDDDDDLIDDEAEETDNDSGDDEDDVDHSDIDEVEEEDESDDATPVRPPAKLQRVEGLFSRNR